MAVYTTSFTDWIRRNWKRFYAALGSFAFVGSFKIVDVIKPTEKYWPKYGTMIPFLVNAVGLLVIVIVITVGRRPPTDNPLNDQASRLIVRFDKNWQRFWAALFLLYLYLLIAHLPPLGPALHPHNDALDLFISNFLGNLATVPMVLCYFCLTWYKSPDHNAEGLVLIGLILLTVPDLMLLVAKYSKTSFLSPNEIVFWQFAITLLGGFIACLTLAMLAGRLESRVIGAPFWPIFLLYFYAALQVPLSVGGPVEDLVNTRGLEVVAEAQTIRAIITISSWFLKGILFLFVYWLLDTGILLYYLSWTIAAEKGPDNIDTKREDFIRSLANGQALVPPSAVDPTGVG